MQSTLTEGFRGAAPAGGKQAPVLYRVLDADRPLAPSGRVLLGEVDAVSLGRAPTPSVEPAREGEVRLLKVGLADRWMSGQHAKLTRVLRRWVLEDTRSKNGVRVNGEPIQRAELEDGDLLELGRTFLLFRDAQPLPPGAGNLESDALGPTSGLHTLVPALAERFERLAKVAPSQVTVALTGESGTGKEVVARAVHALSGRKGPFVAVNCGALPDELVESELFGHRKGAFSGAAEDRAGLIRAAHGGTLFLDEVGDLPLEAQPALLRVLQERQVQPLGATAPQPVDVRVISATHRDLAALSAREDFRDDLRARLSGFSLALPALVDRREDLGLLVAALLRRVAPARADQVTFTLAAARALLLYPWPLNVRELEKALETAVVLAGEDAVDVEHLPAEARAAKGRPKRAAAEREATDVERRAQLEALLREHGGNVSAVARAMGKARMQIQRWLARYGLDPRAYR